MKIALACVEMGPGNLRRQPWYYFEAVFRALTDLGHEAWVVSDREENWADGRPHLAYPGFRAFPRGLHPGLGPRLKKEGFNLVVWSTGLTDFLFRCGLNELGLPVAAVVTSPKYKAAELFAMEDRLNGERRDLRPFLIGPLVTRPRVARFLGQANLKALIFQCRGTRDRYLPGGAGRSRAAVIPPPLPDDFPDLLGEARPGAAVAPGDPFRILYYGPPLKIRGLDVLVQAFALAAPRMPGARLEILSRLEHPELLARENRLKAQVAARGLTEQVDFVSGLLPPGGLAGRLRAAHLVCLPFVGVVSDVPIAVLEAVAAGVPLVTTGVAGVGEFAQNGRSMIVPPGDVPALALAFVHAYAQSRRPKGAPPELGAFCQRHSRRAFREAWGRLLQEAG